MSDAGEVRPITLARLIVSRFLLGSYLHSSNVKAFIPGRGTLTAKVIRELKVITSGHFKNVVHLGLTCIKCWCCG